MGPERQEGPEVLSARVGGPVAGVGLRRAGGGEGGRLRVGRSQGEFNIRVELLSRQLGTWVSSSRRGSG